MADTSTEIAVTPTHRLERVAPKDLQAEALAIREIQKSVLVEDVDYGVIPGTKKPSLYKAGAEILLKWAQLGYRLSVVEVDRDGEGRKYGVTYRASVYKLDVPEVVLAEADGYCGYDENGRDAHVNDWGKSISREPWNTIVAMSAKRAVVAATRGATGTSGLFTQDVEDPAYRERSEANGKGGSAESGPPVITAKFDSKCIVCGNPIKKGEKVVYEKGKGAWHPTCDPRAGDGEDVAPSTDKDWQVPAGQQTATTDKVAPAEKPTAGAITPAHIKGLLFTVRKVAELTGDVLTDEAAYAEIGKAVGVEGLNAWGLDHWTAAQAETAGKELNRNLSDLRKAQETEGKP